MKKYFLALIYQATTSNVDFDSDDYYTAYEEGARLMKEDESVAAMLIYSNDNTAIVVKRAIALKGLSKQYLSNKIRNNEKLQR